MPDIFVENSPNEEVEKNTGHVSSVGASRENVEIIDKELPHIEKGKNSHSHVFAAYCEHPSKIHYSNQLEKEKGLLFLRKHFITNFPWIVKTIALALIPIAVWVISNFFDFSPFDFISTDFLILGIIFYYYLVFGYAFVNYITWFYNISLVTTQRIIDIDFSHIVFENVSASKLGQIQDVHYAQIGVFASIFDYGDVTVQTAGTSVLGFDFLSAPHPEKVVHFINSLIGKIRHGKLA